MRTSVSLTLTVILTGLLSSSALAQATAPQLTSPSPFQVIGQPTQQPAPVPATAAASGNTGGIDYLSGGIGAKERDALLAAEPNYNLKIETAYNTGHYLSDVTIKITDAKGNQLLSVLTDGPLFYAKLEPGTYTVEANFHDIVKTQKITVAAPSGKPKRIVMVWNEPPGDD